MIFYDIFSIGQTKYQTETSIKHYVIYKYGKKVCGVGGFLPLNVYKFAKKSDIDSLKPGFQE